jgi:hypothetical protein
MTAGTKQGPVDAHHLPPVPEALGLAEATHHPRNNSMRAIRS